MSVTKEFVREALAESYYVGLLLWVFWLVLVWRSKLGCVFCGICASFLDVSLGIVVFLPEFYVEKKSVTKEP